MGGFFLSSSNSKSLYFYVINDVKQALVIHLSPKRPKARTFALASTI